MSAHLRTRVIVVCADRTHAWRCMRCAWLTTQVIHCYYKLNVVLKASAMVSDVKLKVCGRLGGAPGRSSAGMPGSTATG